MMMKLRRESTVSGREPFRRIAGLLLPYRPAEINLHLRMAVWSSWVVVCTSILLTFVSAGYRSLFSASYSNQSDFERRTADTCQLRPTRLWSVEFAKLLTESATRMVDINQDGVDDIVLGFATGGDGYQVPDVVCDIYFNGTYPCFGGVLALDGVNGREFWRTYTKHEVFALNCNADLNMDGHKDCLAGGRAAVFLAIDGQTGRVLWEFVPSPTDLSNFYTPQIIPDVNQDGTPEILVAHGGDPLRAPGKPVLNAGWLFLVGGRTGTILKNFTMPDGGETYYSPQVYAKEEGTYIVLFGTGGETHGGSLWAVELQELLTRNQSEIRFVKLISDAHKGVMVPPVLADITHDGTVDIIMALFNSTVIALDGRNFREIWCYTTPSSESYSTPAVGFFNSDDTPDFFINYAVGVGYPIYFYSESTVLDGRTGRPLLKHPIRDAIAVQSSPLTVSMQSGSDYFLFWTAGCRGVENSTDYEQRFRFAKGTKVNQQSRANLCELRFKSEGYSRLYALSQHTALPGVLIYESTGDSIPIEDTLKLAQDYLKRHPEWRLDRDVSGKKTRRHVGAHDSDGMQRLISTGTLAESFAASGAIDLVFATYWFYPSKTVAVLVNDQQCIDAQLANDQQRFDVSSRYYGMDLDAFENMVEEECLTKQSGDQPRVKGEMYRDLFQLKMGSMTVRRVRLDCQLNDAMRPMSGQQWAGYMGSFGSSLSRTLAPV